MRLNRVYIYQLSTDTVQLIISVRSLIEQIAEGGGGACAFFKYSTHVSST